MQTLRSVASSRAGRWLALAVALLVVIALGVRWRRDAANPWRTLIAAANALDHRELEGRLSDAFERRPYRAALHAEIPLALREAASELVTRAGTTREAAAALLVAGNTDEAAIAFAELLRRETGEPELLAAIHLSRNTALLIDFSAASLQRRNARELLVAFEGASRAWQLEHSATAAWNRALAAERIGLPALAAHSWRDAAALETSVAWAREARGRGQVAQRLADAVPAQSAETSFDGERIDIAPNDPLATDTIAALASLQPNDRRRARAALASYTRGRIAFENDRLDEALSAFSAAEAKLRALHVPLTLLARNQRIRAQCSLSHPDCLEQIHAFRNELRVTKRYPWLEARAAYAEGQTFYRRGRIDEAAQWLEQARAGFHRLHDFPFEGVMHCLLANVFTTAGEPDLALEHYLASIAIRSPQLGDRRRRQIEDAISFLLRHGYLSTADALLDDLAALPGTDSARVIESTLRGILDARRGERARAATHFHRAHELLARVGDPAIRADVGMIVAVAEAGSRTDPSHPIVEQIDAAIAQHQGVDQEVWMPQLLAERGAVLEHKGEVAQAERDYRRAIEILEQRSANIDQILIGYGVASDSESPFDRAIRLLLRQGRVADALAIAQRATALRISALYASSAGLGDAFRASREPVKGDSVNAIRRALPNEIAVVYHLLRDELITWVITNGQVIVLRHRVRAKDVVARVERFRECAARRDCRDADTVSDLLLRGWIEDVPVEATLLVQPPAELQGVPFAALRTRDGKRLVFRNAIATAPSLRAFVRTAEVDAERAGASGTFFAAAAHPGGELEPLPLAIDEVRRSSRFYAQPFVDSAVSRAVFIARAPFPAIVHFAGHVIVNDQQPLLSALVFDGGERLYVHELGEQSFAHARLVVLSGCETGRSPRPTMSVAHALLAQNVPSVVYTLWPVSDDAAEEFAIAFHRRMVAGATRAGAVRDAQIALLRAHRERTDDWAAFALAGMSGSLGPLMERRKGEAS